MNYSLRMGFMRFNRVGHFCRLATALALFFSVQDSCLAQADLLGPLGNSKDLSGPSPKTKEDSEACKKAKSYLGKRGKTVPKDCATAIKLAGDLAAQEYIAEIIESNRKRDELLKNAKAEQARAQAENEQRRLDALKKMNEENKRAERERKQQEREAAIKAVEQLLKQPANIDAKLDELSRFDTRNRTSHPTAPGTEADKAIPTLAKQKNRSEKSSVSDVLDGLSDAYGDKAGVDALTQVFGELPADRKTGSKDGMDALKEVFGDLPAKVNHVSANNPLTPVDVPGRGDQDYWQSKRKVLDAATGLDQKNYTPYASPGAGGPLQGIPQNVSRVLPDGGMISITPGGGSANGSAAKSSQLFVNGIDNNNREVIDSGLLVSDKTQTKTTLIYNKDQWNNPGRIWDRQFGQSASDASTHSARKLASETESRVRAGDDVRWVLHSAGVIEAKLAYATVKDRIMSDSDLNSSQKVQMLGSIKILALGGGDTTDTGFEGVGSLHTVVDKNDFVANTVGDGVGTKFTGNWSNAHPLEHYMNSYDGDSWWKNGKTVINSDNESVVGPELVFPSTSRR